MKKLSRRHLRLLIKRARVGSAQKHPTKGLTKNTNTKKRNIVEIWNGKTVEKAVCLSAPIHPPAVLSFEENLNETLEFLSKVRAGIHKRPSRRNRKVNWIERRPNKLPRIRKYFDFKNIEKFGTAPALIVAAAYDRGKVATGEVPPAVNFPNWSPEAFQTLYEMGFFEVIGHAPAERIKEVYQEKLDISYKISKILSGKNADELEVASDILLELLNYLSLAPEMSEDLIIDINSAVSEAMINVARHAYPDDFIKQTDGVCLGKWWMSAKADKSTNTLTIVIYDQGATIPGTLPRRQWYQETIEAVMKAIIPDFDAANRRHTIDHEFINFSMKKGKTQTGNARRGLGLPQMQELIDICPDGTISIVSRQGIYKYAKNIGVFKQALAVELEGTLIEWKLTLPEGAA